jgi:hypothetical protein
LDSENVRANDKKIFEKRGWDALDVDNSFGVEQKSKKNGGREVSPKPGAPAAPFGETQFSSIYSLDQSHNEFQIPEFQMPVILSI